MRQQKRAEQELQLKEELRKNIEDEEFWLVQAKEELTKIRTEQEIKQKEQFKVAMKQVEQH